MNGDPELRIDRVAPPSLGVAAVGGSVDNRKYSAIFTSQCRKHKFIAFLKCFYTFLAPVTVGAQCTLPTLGV